MGIILVLEIVVVIAALVVLAASTLKVIGTGRQLVRVAGRFQEQTASKTAGITSRADTAQELAQRLPERADLLERRGQALSESMRRLAVIAEAAAEAKQPLDKVRDYLGL